MAIVGPVKIISNPVHSNALYIIQIYIYIYKSKNKKETAFTITVKLVFTTNILPNKNFSSKRNELWSMKSLWCNFCKCHYFTEYFSILFWMSFYVNNSPLSIVHNVNKLIMVINSDFNWTSIYCNSVICRKMEHVSDRSEKAWI